MKKFVIFLLFIMGIIVSGIAEDTSNGTDSTVKIAFLLEDGLWKNEKEIRNESINLNSMQKLMLYEDYKKSAGVPFVCNFLLGFGIGSFVQKDYTGGFIGLGGDLLGYIVMLSGFSMTAEETYYSNGYYYTQDVITDDGLNTVATGMIIFLGVRVFELIRPFSYSNNYNKQLRKDIGFYNISFKIEPVISEGISKIDASFKINF